MSRARGPAVRRVLLRDHGAPVILSPAQKVIADRERQARDAEQRAKNTAARKAHRLARAVASNPLACRICGTPISDPRSIERGIGPRCFAHRVTSGSIGEPEQKESK